MGILEKKWALPVNDLLQKLSNNGLDNLGLSLLDMNESFILLRCCQPDVINLFIINVNGELVWHVKEEGEKLDFFFNTVPIYAHLSGNNLIYKNRKGHDVKFLHIPTKKIQSFDWTKSIEIVGLSTGSSFIQNIRFSEEKLTILISTKETYPMTIIRPNFKIIQFDLNAKIPERTWRKMLNGMISNLKNSYNT